MKAVGKEGKHPPPVLYSDLEYVWNAFAALSTSRTDSTSITFSEIESWLNLNGITNLERRQEVAHLVRIMDEKFLEYIREKQSKNRGN